MSSCYRQNRSFLPCMAAVVLLAPLYATSASSTADAVFPPGLYRIGNADTKEVAHDDPSSTMQTHVDGATGNFVRQGSVGGAQPKVVFRAAGNGPLTVCLATSEPTGLPPGIAGSAGCVSGPGVAGPSGVVFKSSCSYADTTVTIRKLDARTWRIESVAAMKMNSSKADTEMSNNYLQLMMEEKLKTARTAAERAEAAELLAQLPGLKAQQIAESSQRRAILGGSNNKTGTDIKDVRTMTRIADSCDPKKKYN